MRVQWPSRAGERPVLQVANAAVGDVGDRAGHPHSGAHTVADSYGIPGAKTHARGLKVVMCPDVEVAFPELGGGIVRVEVPAGVDTVALLVLHGQ